MFPVLLLWLLNVLLIIDWAQNKRPRFWLGVLIFFGPLGALAYVVYFYEDITFPIPLARTLRGLGQAPKLRACPRCGQARELKAHQDGRQLHLMCDECARLTFAPAESRGSRSDVVARAKAIVEEVDRHFAEKLTSPVAVVEAEPETVEAEPVEVNSAWAADLTTAQLSDDMLKALKRLVKLESRFGREQDQSPSLYVVDVVSSTSSLPETLDEAECQALLAYVQGLIPELEPLTPAAIRDSRRAIPADKLAAWLTSHLMEDYGEPDEEGNLAPTKRSKRARKERDKLLTQVADDLVERLPAKPVAYRLSNEPPVFFLAGEQTGLIWATH
ncbi:MAG: hypothetical protein AB7S38_29300 [Vulcanimicrobiota bacterium]